MAAEDTPDNVVLFRSKPQGLPALTVDPVKGGSYQEAYTIVFRRQAVREPGDTLAIIDGPLKAGRPLLPPDDLRSVAEDLEALAVYLRRNADQMEPDNQRRYVGQVRIFSNRQTEWGIDPALANANTAIWLDHVVTESLANLVAQLRKGP